MLGVRFGVDDSAQWSMVKMGKGAAAGRRPHARRRGACGPDGRPHRLHDLIDDSFLALYFTDARRRPAIPAQSLPGLKHYVVSRWDAPLDSGLRDRALLDVGERLFKARRLPPDTLVLVRPDDHVAAIAPMREGLAEDLYRRIIGK